MASDIERLMVRLEANATSFEKALARAERNADKSTGAIEKHFERANRGVKRQIDAISQSTTALGSSLAGVAARVSAAAAGVFSVGALKSYTDDWQTAVNKIAAANNTLAGSQQRASQLTDIAIRSFGDLATTADLYAGLTRSTKDMGASQAQVLAVTETLTKAFAVGGQAASTQAGALTQLNQALASGKLSGDEFNSVAEGAPIIMDLLAKKLGVTRGELKALASEGAITSKVMVEALLEGATVIEEQFSKLVPTIDQSLNRLKASVTRYFGQIATEQNFAGKFAEGTQLVLDNLDAVMRGAAVAGVALIAAFTPIGAPIAAAAAALALFGDQIQPISGSIATLGDYARAAFSIIGQEGGSAFETFRNAVAGAADALVTVFTGAVNTASQIIATISSVVTTVMNAVIGVFVGSTRAIALAWSGLGSAITGSFYDAMNAVVKMVNDAVAKIVSGLNSVLSAVRLPTISAPSLGGIDNPYKGAAAELGAGIKQAFSDALGAEYIADPVKQVDGALSRIKAKADEISEARRADALLARVRNNVIGAPNDGDINAPLRTPAGAGSGGGGGGTSAEKQNEFEKEIAAIEKRIAAFGREREALSLSAQEASKAEAAHRLLDAAKQAGIPVTDELRKRVDDLAGAYSTAKASLDAAKQSQEEFKQLQQFVGQSLSGFFSDIVSGGKNASDALMNMTKKLADAAFQAALLGQGPLASLFGTAPAEKGGVGGLIGGLFSSLGGGGGGGGGGFLSGVFSAPALAVGTSNVPQDMLAMIHKGEMVIPRYDAELLRKGQAGGAAGGTIEVVLSASPELDARIGRVSEGVSVRVTRQAIATNNRMLPGMLAENQAR